MCGRTDGDPSGACPDMISCTGSSACDITAPRIALATAEKARSDGASLPPPPLPLPSRPPPRRRAPDAVDAVGTDSTTHSSGGPIALSCTGTGGAVYMRVGAAVGHSPALRRAALSYSATSATNLPGCWHRSIAMSAAVCPLSPPVPISSTSSASSPSLPPPNLAGTWLGSPTSSLVDADTLASDAECPTCDTRDAMSLSASSTESSGSALRHTMLTTVRSSGSRAAGNVRSFRTTLPPIRVMGARPSR